jgi:hypothetical protein
MEYQPGEGQTTRAIYHTKIKYQIKIQSIILKCPVICSIEFFDAYKRACNSSDSSAILSQADSPCDESQNSRSVEVLRNKAETKHYSYKNFQGK